MSILQFHHFSIFCIAFSSTDNLGVTLTVLEEDLLCKYVATYRASPRISLFMFELNRRGLAFSSSALFNLSDLPFNCSVYGTLQSNFIPFSLIQFNTLLFTYSRPLSHLSLASLLFQCASTFCTYSLIVSATPDLCRSKYVIA